MGQVASYHFKRFPILGAAFTPTGDQVDPNLSQRSFKIITGSSGPGPHDGHDKPNLGSSSLKLTHLKPEKHCWKQCANSCIVFFSQ